MINQHQHRPAFVGSIYRYIAMTSHYVRGCVVTNLSRKFARKNLVLGFPPTLRHPPTTHTQTIAAKERDCVLEKDRHKKPPMV